MAAKSKKEVKKEVKTKKVEITPEEKKTESWLTDFYKNRKKQGTYAVLLLIVILGAFLYMNANWIVAATVNGKPIYRYKLISELEKQGGKQVLDQMVSMALVDQKAQEAGITVTQEEIDKEIETINKGLEAQGTDIDTALSLQGQTRADFEEQLRTKLKVMRLLSDKLTATDEELKTFYETSKEYYESQEMTLENSKEEITSNYLDQKLSEVYSEWLNQVRAEAKINTLVTF